MLSTSARSLLCALFLPATPADPTLSTVPGERADRFCILP
jgi:hypothetical protein